MLEYLRVGKIVTTHGLKGEVKVYPTTDDISRFKLLKEVYMGEGNDRKVLEIESIRFQKNMVLMKIKGYDDIDEVEPLRQKDIFVSREDGTPLEEGEYYMGDLYGIDVLDEDGTVLGTVKEILETGANNVYVVKREGKDLLIPAIPQCILKLNPEEGYMKVHLLEGLLDL